MSTPTLEAASTPAVPTSTVRRYRLVVLLLVVALAASIAAAIYLATRPSPTADPPTAVPSGTSQFDCGYRPPMPC
jgi:hypothetical protein